MGISCVTNSLLLMLVLSIIIEKVFSLLNKKKPKGIDRSRLDIKGSLSLILAVIRDRPESISSCLGYNRDDKFLHRSPKKQL